MYKVFINDKEVRFQNKSELTPKDCHELNQNLNPVEIVSSVQLFPIPGARIFYIRSDNSFQLFKQFTEYFPLIKAAGGIVRNYSPDGPILMIHRLGKWDLPKGKMDPGESPEEASIREVQEECGIVKLRIVKKLADTFHLYELRGVTVLKITYWYLMLTDYNGALTPQLEEGITEVKWVHENEISMLLPATYASIAELLSEKVLNR